MNKAQKYLGYLKEMAWPKNLQAYPTRSQFLVLRANGWLDPNMEYDNTQPPRLHRCFRTSESDFLPWSVPEHCVRSGTEDDSHAFVSYSNTEGDGT
jgi:hypothetical protein